MENTYRKAILTGNGRIEIKTVSNLPLKEDEVEIRVCYAGICSSDIQRAYGNGSYHYPIVLGHEIAGIVSRVGTRVSKSLKEGTLVAVFPLLPCFSCKSCADTNHALCSNYSYYGSRQDGGFSEILHVKEWNVIPLPSTFNLIDAALLEPTSVVLHSVKKAIKDHKNNEKICILGGGFLGLLALQIIKNIHPQCDVHVVDRNHFKLEKASAFGAVTHAVVGETDLQTFAEKNNSLFHTTLELVGHPQSFLTSIEITKPSGKIVWTGNPSDNILFEKSLFSQILRKELKITGSWNSTYKGKITCDWTEAVKLIHDGLKPSSLITDCISIEKIDNTLSKMYDHKVSHAKFPAIKFMVRFET